MTIEQSSDGTEYAECAVCGLEPDPERIPPHYVLSLAEGEREGRDVQSYPFGGSLSVPFACSDECWLNAERDGFDRYVEAATEHTDKSDDL